MFDGDEPLIVSSSTIDKKLEITKNSKIDSKLTKNSKINSKFSSFFVNFEFNFEVFVDGEWSQYHQNWVVFWTSIESSNQETLVVNAVRCKVKAICFWDIYCLRDGSESQGPLPKELFKVEDHCFSSSITFLPSFKVTLKYFNPPQITWYCYDSHQDGPLRM